MNNNIDESRKRNIGKRLRLLRGDTSQTERARQLQVTQPYLSQVEMGKRLPSLEMLLYLAKEQHTTVGFLLGETDNRLPETRPAETGDEERSGVAARYVVTSEEPSVSMLLACAQQKLQQGGHLSRTDYTVVELLLKSCAEALHAQSDE